MWYLVESLSLPKELEGKTYDKGKDSMSFVCKNCGAELHWEFNYPGYSYYKSWEYRRAEYEYMQAKDNLERNRRLYPGRSFSLDESLLKDLEQKFNLQKERKEQYDFTKRIADNAHQRYQDALQNAVCPICGAGLVQEKGYYLPPKRELREKWYNTPQFWSRSKTEGIFELLANARKSIEHNQITLEASNYVKNCDLYIAPSATPKSAEIQQDSEALKSYILHLIHLENNIYSLQQQLTDLYYRRLLNDRLIVLNSNSKSFAAKQELKELQIAYEETLKALDAAKSAQLPEISVSYPNKPISPVLGTPGLFNKKKVLEENKRLLETYKLQVERYNKELKRCDDEKARLTAQAQAEHDAEVLKAQEYVDAEKIKLEAAEEQVNALLKTTTPVLTPANAIKSILDKEIAETEELIKKSFAARNELYAQEVIFGKYRDTVALSSFYEYLMSGRCDSLSGANGAYNIYESEIRANRIIAQLDTVISSLEEIKQNQYMMYQEMRSINSSLQSLNSTMDKALSSIQNIEVHTDNMNGYLEHIAQNSDVVAHNTAATAYYSKMNAELTNALGYMVAFK